MTIHFLVEGPSEVRLLQPWLKRAMKQHGFSVHPHQGKGTLDLARAPDARRRGLLDQLPQKLKGFANALDGDCDAVVVLVDADDDDCKWLADSIRSAARQVAPKLKVVVRVAVEEVEAFYFGDLSAIHAAFPSADMKRCRAFEPDTVVGTWEAFGTAIGSDGGNKTRWAEAIGPHLTVDPKRSRSPSFRALLRSVLDLDRCAPERAKKRNFIFRSKRATRRPAKRR
jgi:hypothetical protein